MFDGASTFTRARLVGINDEGDHQRLELEGFAGERFTNVVRSQAHGYSSNPPIGSVGYVMRMGESDRLFAQGFETQGRPRNMVAGGAVLYDDSGNQIYAKNAGGLEIKAVQGGLSFSAGGDPVKITSSASGSLEIAIGSMKILMTSSRIDLGGPGGAAVQTVSGPSNKVFAIL